MTEQGIRGLKSNLNEAAISLAQVKSVVIRLRREADEEVRRADREGRGHLARFLEPAKSSGGLHTLFDDLLGSGRAYVRHG